MNPDLRKEGACRCYWFDKDDLGWDGYLEWCERHKDNFDMSGCDPRFDELE